MEHLPKKLLCSWKSGHGFVSTSSVFVQSLQELNGSWEKKSFMACFWAICQQQLCRVLYCSPLFPYLPNMRAHTHAHVHTSPTSSLLPSWLLKVLPAPSLSPHILPVQDLLVCNNLVLWSITLIKHDKSCLNYTFTFNMCHVSAHVWYASFWHI